MLRHILIALNLALALLCAGWFFAFPIAPAWWLDFVCSLALVLFAGSAWALYRRWKFTAPLASFAIVAGTLLFFGTEDAAFPLEDYPSTVAVAFLVNLGAMWAVGLLSVYRGLLYVNKRRGRSRRKARLGHIR